MGELSDEVAARFEQFKHHFDRQARKAEELAAEANAINAKIEAQVARVKQGLPSPESCVDCWVKDGVDARHVPRKAADPTNFDRWTCPKCGRYHDVKFKS